ncbi:hypothetical protein [Polyangium aurulentum]|uniref:hypothetical protein n=1 Tax=Polyangium aurulentum TaxID=2567896 RepID=UPI0010ADE44F|nr:hypothetical protein [Polyangium aurulentum]UQA62995.1 hypothetical protein E8A73_022070 [Polyangium aurulentum]
MFTHGKLLCASILAALATSACGEEARSVEDMRPISTLSEDERKDVVTMIADDVGRDRVQRAPARLVCLATLALVEQCDDARLDACVDELVEEGEPGLRFSHERDLPTEQCEVAVGELAQCVIDFHEALDRMTCADANDGAPEPDACKPVRARCPAALELELPSEASER